MMQRIASLFAIALFLTGTFGNPVFAHYIPNNNNNCPTCPKEADDPVLFTINGKEVLVSEFTYIYNKTNGDKADYSEKSLNEYLQLYVDFKLQVAEGVEMGLDKNPDVLREQNQYKRQLSSTYLSDREITEKLVKEAYEWGKEDRKISHILVAVQENAPENEVTEAFARIKKVKDQATSANFGDLAKQFSDDSYSKNTGGDLGFFTVLQLPYDLEKAMYGTPKDGISEIIRSKFGFHLIKVTEVRPAFGQVQLAQILIRPKTGEEASKKLIDSLYEVLKTGGNFEELAGKYSEDNSTKTRGGIIGWVGINRFTGDFEKTVFGLSQDNAVSAPIKSTAGWHLLKRVKAMKNPSYQEVKGELTNKIKQNERFKIVQDALVERIKKEANFKQAADVTEKLLEILAKDATFLQSRWNPDQTLLNNEDVLFTVGDRKGTVKEFVQLAQRSPNERFSMQPRTAKGAMDRIMDNLVAQKCMEYEETQLDKKYPEFKALMREYEEGILLFEVKKQLIWDKASTDEEGLKKFYDENKSKYQWKERARVTFYTVRSTDSKLLKSIKKVTKKGTADAVKNEFNKDNAVVQTTEATYEKGKNAEVDAIKWKVGTVSTGYAKDGSSYFIKVEEVLPSSNKSLDEARGYVVADYQDSLEKTLIKKLREKFEVKINQDVLKGLVKKK